MVGFMNSLHKNLSLILGASLLAACGGEGSSSSNYKGYMPKFSSQYLSSTPVKSSPSAPAFKAQSVSGNVDGSDEQANDLSITKVDCSEATKIFNAAPQAANFSNSSFEFVVNLQAQTNFYDCIVREQVFNYSADLTNEEDDVRVVSAFNVNASSYYSSWKMPASIKDMTADKDLQVNAEGKLINLQPDIDQSKTRVDLSQGFIGNSQFIKEIKTTLQDEHQGVTNIRSSHIKELRSSVDGSIIEQRVAGRITFENKISAVSSILKPGAGAVFFLKQCDETAAASSNDYQRACSVDWSLTAYDSDFKLLAGAAEENLLSQFGLTKNGSSVLPEVMFFFSESESAYFDSRDLPAPTQSN